MNPCTIQPYNISDNNNLTMSRGCSVGFMVHSKHSSRLRQPQRQISWTGIVLPISNTECQLLSHYTSTKLLGKRTRYWDLLAKSCGNFNFNPLVHQAKPRSISARSVTPPQIPRRNWSHYKNCRSSIRIPISGSQAYEAWNVQKVLRMTSFRKFSARNECCPVGLLVAYISPARHCCRTTVRSSSMSRFTVWP